MKTAKALGFTIPQSCLLHADDVIGWAREFIQPKEGTPAEAGLKDKG